MERVSPVLYRILFALVLAAGSVSPRFALAAGDVFTVRNIPVDATAAGAAEAREIAIAQGERAGFERLVPRLTRKQDWGFTANVTEPQVAALVLGIEVAEERSSATRYFGRITYSFKPGAVRQLLNQSQIPFSEARSKPAIVLPVLDSGGLHLWDDPNPWRTAWARRDLTDELVPVLVPLNDLEDSNLVSAAKAANATWADVSAIAEKYGLERVLVAVAHVRGGTLTVNISQIAANQNQSSSFSFPVGTDLTASLDQAVGSALDRVYDQWKTATIVVYGQENTLLASTFFSNLSDWLSIQRRLRQAPTVHSVDILGLSSQGAQIRLSYGGTVEQLKITLEQISLALSERDGYWELALTERAARAAPAAAGTTGTTGPAPAKPALKPHP